MHPSMEMTHGFGHTPRSLAAVCSTLGMPHYAAGQILRWVYRRSVTNLQQMTDLAARHRRVLNEVLRFDTATERAHQVASDGTRKLLLEWPGGAGAPGRSSECVLIPTEARLTACLSSQVGCPVGCRFCASGLGGLQGNLSAGEIVEQAHRLSRLPGVTRLTNVVFMGMGEPLANLGAVQDAIVILHADWGMNISARRITVSTVGLPAGIRKLARFELPVTLALSLHAPDDDLRRQLIPWARAATIDELLDACDEFFTTTGREITLEYLLLREVNDRPEHARALATIARRLRANVNLIRYNEVRGLPFQRPATRDVLAFQAILKKQHVAAHLRASRGRDIAAACGQLRQETDGAGTGHR